MKAYINRFFSLNAAPDILPFFGTNNHRASKEITESFAMWRAALDVLKLDGKEDLVVVVVGDGVRPRTAAVFAHLTKWHCYSVDSHFDTEWYREYVNERKKAGTPLKRLILIQQKIEDVDFFQCKGKRALLVLPHSHAKMEDSLKAVKGYSRLDVISMPCCVKVEERYLEKRFALEHHLFTYKDPNVWSPKNTIHVWQDM